MEAQGSYRVGLSLPQASLPLVLCLGMVHDMRCEVSENAIFAVGRFADTHHRSTTLAVRAPATLEAVKSEYAE